MVNLSGVWILNLAKSLLQSPPPDTSVFRIEHHGQTFCLDRTHVMNGVPDSFRIECQTDGMVEEKNIRGVDISVKMVWKGDVLVFDSVFRQGDEEALNKVKYSLMDEGRTLKAEEEFISREHHHHNLWVFDKNAESYAASGDVRGIPESPQE